MAQDYSSPHQDLINLVPSNLRNPVLVGLLDNLFNRFLTPDEAVPLYGYVGRRPSRSDDRTTKVPQSTIERDINALIPVMSFNVGAETHAFTPQDLERKALTLGISSDLSSWLFSQGNNFAPPIDFDKFTNFFNYFWVAKALPTPPVLSWNPANAPEYYTIAKPKDTDLDKLSVSVATSPSNSNIVLTGTGFHEQTFTVTFTSSSTFTVSCVLLPGIDPSLQTQSFTLPPPAASNTPFPGPWPTDTMSYVFQMTGITSQNGMMRFSIARDMVLDGTGQPLGYESFAVGDTFTIVAPFLSTSYSVSFTGSAGTKGKIVGVNSLDVYQTIDGKQVKEGERVLVKNQGLSSQNGIYVVKPGAWVRAADFDGVSAVLGSRVFVRDGATNANSLFTSSAPSWTWVSAPSATPNTNDWQEANYWVHGNDLIALGYDIAKVTQAVRPIIEFHADVQLNGAYGGAPSDVGTRYAQRKTEFNQEPLFDLYFYNGRHSRRVSPIFFYLTDPAADVDIPLQRRAKRATNSSSDFMFGHGLISGDQTLFYRTTSGELKSIWHPGYREATVVDQTKFGTGNGTLTISLSDDPFTPQQVWTLTALTSTQFDVSGSKHGALHDVINVGTPYDNGLFKASIIQGTLPFQPGDTFIFRIGNLETTRYVKLDENKQLIDVLGGEAADLGGEGAWLVPKMFYHNLAADGGGEIPEGTLYSHFRGILANQVQGLQENRAFGGAIKLWSEQQNLLASLLMQRDLTPVSIIDAANRQYASALNNLSDVFFTHVIHYFSTVDTAITPLDEMHLLDHLLEVIGGSERAKHVLYDTTSGVTGFPVTLPMMRVTPAVQPTVYFDEELGIDLLLHHDGHVSQLFSNDADFIQRFISSNLMLTRSDGSVTPAIGSTTLTPPPNPYKGEVWMRPAPGGTEMLVFGVIGDTNIGPLAEEIGEYWYNRPAGVLYRWSGIAWEAEPSVLSAWVPVNLAGILNRAMLNVEERLYDACNAFSETYFSSSDVANALTGRLKQHLSRELSTWAVQNGVDPLAADYKAADPFTWNYSTLGAGTIAPLDTQTPARWFNVLTAHQRTVPGVVPTPRPNLEPWKLMGYASKPAGWDAQYAALVKPDDVTGWLIGLTAKAVKSANQGVLSGLPVIDGVQLNVGDRVLLTGEIAPANNGLWVVSAGAWTRATQPMVTQMTISVVDGARFSGTRWAITTAPLNLNFDPIVITQVRDWKPVMWDDIQAARPTLRLSVDVDKDALLPPYVAASLPAALNALTTTLPANPAKSYEFGQSSPVETVWRKSIDYRYAMTRALFRSAPLDFLAHCWGFMWKTVDGISYDSYDMAMPGHRRFKLHGESIAPVGRITPVQATLITPSGASSRITAVLDGVDSQHRQIFTIRDGDGVKIGYAISGVSTSISIDGNLLSVTLDDEGTPFRIGDKLSITVNGVNLDVAFDQASWYSFLGFGQVFTQALRDASIDTTGGYAVQAYRGWTVNLGYRAGGLVSTEDLRVYTDDLALPESSFKLHFKRAEHAKDLWLQALRVQVVQVGSSTVNSSGFVPTGSGSDWVFRVEGYNSRYVAIEYYALDDTNNFSTFTALEGNHTAREWRQYHTKTGLVKTQVPFTVTGIQALVNVLYGYALLLEEQGWSFDDEQSSNIDAQTGRVRGFQLEIEKLIDRLYSGIDVSQGHVINPFIDRVWVKQPTGLVSRFFDTPLFDITAHPGVFDALGIKMLTSELYVQRRREQAQISAKVPMFSVHAQLDEFEHLFIFNNLTSPSTGEGLIYDPFSGARIVTLKFNGRRQAAKTLRPEFGGHFLVRHEVRRNIKASVDKINRYYDTDHVFEDGVTTNHALALLGFSTKEYMTALDLNERSQFNFWRGLIQMKGTNTSIKAFLNNNRFEDAKLDEYWAYKVAEYGDSRSRVFPELKLTVDDTLRQFTKLQFNALTLDGFTRIDTDDEARWFSIDDLGMDATFDSQVTGSFTLPHAEAGRVIDLPFVSDQLVLTGGTRLNASTLLADGGPITAVGYGPSAPKFNPVKLFNYVANELVEEIPIWHPSAGQHTPAALSSINITSSIDPARYNSSTQLNGNPNYDPLHAWGQREVGRVWWDTRELDYVPYYDYDIYTTIDERLNRWGTLADYANVNVLEWVESTVPPQQYDAQSSVDAGNADLDTVTKASGQVYGAKTYSRERVWHVRPIAWSHAGVALEAAHPSFNASAGAGAAVLYLRDLGSRTIFYLSDKTFSDLGVNVGARIGGWEESAALKRPLSEYVINGFEQHLTGLTLPVVGPSSTVNVTSIARAGRVGDLIFTALPVQDLPVTDADGVILTHEWSTSLQITNLDSNEADVVFLRTDRGDTLAQATMTVVAGQTMTFTSSLFGLSISVTFSSAGTFPTTALQANIVTALNTGLRLHDAANVTPIVPSTITQFSNDELDQMTKWRSWVVPTQAQLDADAIVPNGAWKPYTGEYITRPSSIEIVQDAATNRALSLNDGTVVERYATSWQDWQEIKSTTLRAVQSTTGPLSVTLPSVVTDDRISVYLNGVAQLAGTYGVNGTALTMNLVPAGNRVTVVVRGYTPTAKELQFDPAALENLLIQRQYKIDYQYVFTPVRNEDGSITASRYYFWVKNRTVAARGKQLSVKAIEQLIVDGPSQYLVFQNLQNVNGRWLYDSIAIAGLNYLVTKNDTFKLRFTRNFTLRDDPNQLDLKDTHAEWKLIRPGQRVKVPEQLWQKMVDAACGKDAAGNEVPAPRRVAYDERNGTFTRYGFGVDQIMAPTDLVRSTLAYTLLNTKLVESSGSITVPDYVSFLDLNQSNEWFRDAATTRSILTRIWNEAKVAQVNELFFAVLEDIVSSNHELTDIFKTSRLSAYSIKVVPSISSEPAFE